MMRRALMNRYHKRLVALAKAAREGVLVEISGMTREEQRWMLFGDDDGGPKGPGR